MNLKNKAPKTIPIVLAKTSKKSAVLSVVSVPCKNSIQIP